MEYKNREENFKFLEEKNNKKIKHLKSEIEFLQLELKGITNSVKKWRKSKPHHTSFNPQKEGFEFILSSNNNNSNDLSLYHKIDEKLSLDYEVSKDIWHFTSFTPALGYINGKSGSGILLYSGKINSNKEFKKLKNAYDNLEVNRYGKKQNIDSLKSIIL